MFCFATCKVPLKLLHYILFLLHFMMVGCRQVNLQAVIAAAGDNFYAVLKSMPMVMMMVKINLVRLK